MYALQKDTHIPELERVRIFKKTIEQEIEEIKQSQDTYPQADLSPMLEVMQSCSELCDAYLKNKTPAERGGGAGGSGWYR